MAKSAKRAAELPAREVEEQELHGRQFEEGTPEHAEEMAWARRYRQDVAHFPGEFVALSSNGIVAHSADLFDLMTRLEQAHPERVYIVSVPAPGALAV